MLSSVTGKPLRAKSTKLSGTPWRRALSATIRLTTLPISNRLPARVDITANPTSTGCDASGKKPSSNTTNGTLPIRLLASREAVASDITPCGSRPCSIICAATPLTAGNSSAAPLTTNSPANSRSRFQSTLCT
ncbi:hypothetical protein FQZ97_909030 [compost metagenome]